MVLGCGVVAALHVGKAAIATPLLQADLALSLGQAGWLTGIFAVLGVVGGAPAGALVAVVGDRRSLLVGLLTMAIAGAVGALTDAYSVLLASRLVEGLGFLLTIVAGPALLQRLTTGAQRDMAFSLWSCFMPCGMAIAMLVGPFFQTWASFWWASSALAAMAAVTTLYCVPGGGSHAGLALRSMIGGIRQLLSSKGTVLLACCFALYSLMFFALFSFLPVLLMERMNVTYQTAGLLAALASVINVSGNLAAGHLMAHGAGRTLLIAVASCLMGLSGIGIFLGLFPAMPTFLLCLLFSAIGGLIPATLLASAPLLAPHASLVPIAVGLIMQGSNIGQLVGPVAVGSATAAYGWSAAGAVVLISATATCFIAARLRPSFRQ
ncbi:MFS transporter [Pseudomonas knackmussii]|uniref:MFS transporter n=1 Tax=Pseudomonas knackmussii TaxID=65741 RepID=A0ABY4KVG2_9PSED|nr:MFS transporter [Pseudomonas knackmussii]UPQ84861.1 MFS transporter [Pseudomonas knackmussii]